MDKPKWGCPSCGSGEVVQHVKLSATREGTFRPSGDGWEFDSDDDYDRDSLEVDDEGEFECGACGEEFDRPARVREGDAIRVALKLCGEAFQPDKNGVDQELDDDLSARFEIVCSDKEQVARLFQTLRLFLEGVVGSARAA